MFKRRDTKLIVENWRKFISESKEIKKYFYDEEFENFINNKKNVIENTIEVINTEFINQKPINMLDFREKSIIPKLKELIDTLLIDFKQEYINNPEVKMKRMPQYLDDEFSDDCLDVCSYITKNNQAIHTDLQRAFEAVRTVDLN